MIFLTNKSGKLRKNYLKIYKKKKLHILRVDTWCDNTCVNKIILTFLLKKKHYTYFILSPFYVKIFLNFYFYVKLNYFLI